MRMKVESDELLGRDKDHVELSTSIGTEYW
jgi:hypothetical protein